MEDRAPPEDLEQLVDRLEDAAERSDRVSVDLLMDEVGRRSFGPLLLLAGLLMAAPIIGDIPGVPVLLGLFILLIAVQILVGHDHFWMPQWLLRRSVEAEKLRKTSRKWLRRPAQFVDRFLRHRLKHWVGGVGLRAIAIVSALLALSTPVAEFIPFSANGVGAAIAMFGLALVAHDGLLALIGWIIVATTVALAIWSVI